jgi:Tfp pilus assembly protein FimV
MAAIVHLEPVSTRPALRLVAPLRPTRADYARRRLAVLLVALLVAVLAVRLLAGLASSPDTTVSTGSTGAPAVTVHSPLAYGSSGTPLPDRATYVVQPGDTVWSIAEQLAPAGDVRGMVDRIVELNGGAALAVGQHLRLS